MPTPAVKTLEEGPFLWTAKLPQGDIHLFGTVHIGVDVEQELPKVIEIFKGATELVLEADLSQVDRKKTIATSEWISAISDSEKQQYQSLTKVPLEALQGFKPFVAYTQLIVSQLPTTPPMDQHLERSAKQSGVAVGYLESANSQIDLLSSLYGASELKELLADPAAIKKDSDELIAAYKIGSEDKMWNVMSTSPTMDEGMLKKLLDDRNKAWVPKIEKLNAGAFVAVGAGHLVGPRSVVALLREKGIRVERVKLH